MTLMEYLIKTGSERVSQQCKENMYAVQTLKDFQYVDRDGKDQGVNVREKAKQLVALLRDEDRLREERAHALKTKEKLAQTATGEPCPVARELVSSCPRRAPPAAPCPPRCAHPRCQLSDALRAAWALERAGCPQSCECPCPGGENAAEGRARPLHLAWEAPASGGWGAAGGRAWC